MLLIITKYLLLRYANQVLFGDEVLIDKNNKLISSKVIKVSSFKMQGNYIPLNILGILCVIYLFNDCSLIIQ